MLCCWQDYSNLHLSEEDGLLASLIVLPQNESWWSLMTKLINYEHTWSVAACASIAWVLVAYILTVINSFSDITDAINANGQGVGSLWLRVRLVFIEMQRMSTHYPAVIADCDRLAPDISKVRFGSTSSCADRG